MEEDIHNEFKKHIGAACISYNAEQSLLVVLVSTITVQFSSFNL